MNHRCLTREEISAVIEGKGGAERIPMMYHFWSNPDIFKKHREEAAALMEQYPYDIETVWAVMPQPSVAPEDDPTYKWLCVGGNQDYVGGIDANVQMPDWDHLDEILEHFPSPEYPGLFPKVPPRSSKYRVVCWWNCLFERFWSLRGMENALTDFYLYPEETHRLFQKLIDFYLRVIERAHDELHTDAIFLSDDIGTQNATFFSEEIFLEFFKPYYKQVIDKAHSLGMHFWLHTCGNVRSFIPHLVDLGLDVLHPIQKYTMDQKEIADLFGDSLCIWAGFDVQRIIPYGTPEEVRQEVRAMIDTYARKEGRLMLTCGNGLTPDCKIESFRALLEESFSYGQETMRRLRDEA